MRWLLVIVLVVAAVLGGIWLGGESWLAGRATAALDQRDDLGAAAVNPLREISRVGLRAEQVDYTGRLEDGTDLSVSLPWLELWSRPTSPQAFHATLPEQLSLVVGATPVAMLLDDAQGMLRLSPVNNLAVTRAEISVDSAEIDGQAILNGLAVDAELTGLGYDAPRAANAAYDVSLQLQSLEPAALAAFGAPQLAVPGAISAQGNLRLWLSAAPGRGMLQGRSHQVQPVGLRTDGLELGLGDLRARLVGVVSADAEGRAEGRLALYTADSREWLRAASDAGLIPESAVMLGGAMLQGLSSTPMSAEPATDSASQQDGSQLHAATEFTFPEPATDELRIPIFLRDGQAFLGAIPIGPAPQFLGG
ncbi:DUF2125 domain-containing protein [Paracoccus tegillarcae]|nr:DUF2125 domain-containing protein [Paracoccus tegillarcae]